MGKNLFTLLDGREVESFVMQGAQEESLRYRLIDCKSKNYDSMVYYCEHLGEYGIDWICCFKDGKLVEQFNARCVERVKFAEEEE